MNPSTADTCIRPARSVRRAASARRSNWTAYLAPALLIFGLLLGARWLWPAPHAAPSRNENATAFSPVPVSTAKKQLITAAIENIKLGDRIAGRNPIREQVELVEPDPATWRRIDLYMQKESGAGLWIELLRPREWIIAVSQTRCDGKAADTESIIAK